MKLLTPAFALCLALTFACSEKPQVVKSTAERIALIDSLLASYQKPPQIFTVSSQKPSTVTGKEGTILFIDPAKLEATDQSPLGENITVELREMTSATSMALNNAPTVSNDQLLVSGGAYYIGLSSNNKSLQLKEGQTMKAEFPKIAEENMSLFYGKKDSLGAVNWEKSEADFETKNLKKPTKPEEPNNQSLRIKGTWEFEDIENILAYVDSTGNISNSEEYQKELKRYLAQNKRYEEALKNYAEVDLTALGYINCDRFLKSGEILANVSLSITDGDIDNAKFYLVFSDINSVMESSLLRPFHSPAFRNIPINKKVKLVGFAVNENKTYTFSKNFKVAQNQEIQVSFAETTEREMQHMIGGL
ncbi:MAG: hypothetical protein AB8F95_04885 [Bacteroidia bacterium]